MKETSKCHLARLKRGDYDRFLHGLGIDVGAGDDLLSVPNGQVHYWDMPQGDAQCLHGVADQSLDFLYSCHCLEHLPDLGLTLSNWSRVLKPGGYAYVVVPDYTLYEHHLWPSAHNGGHLHSFSLWLSRSKVMRSNHWCIPNNEFRAILGDSSFELLETELQDINYDYNLGWMDQTLGVATAQILTLYGMCLVWNCALLLVGIGSNRNRDGRHRSNIFRRVRNAGRDEHCLPRMSYNLMFELLPVARQNDPGQQEECRLGALV
jgi:SAM-dependent methyltransferase